MPSTVVDTVPTPSRLMCAVARSRRSWPATGSDPATFTESLPASVNFTWDMPSSRLRSSKESSTSPSIRPTTAPLMEVGRSPLMPMSWALAWTSASETRFAATSGTVTSTRSSRLDATWVRNGNPWMSTAGRVARPSDCWSVSSAVSCAYNSAARSPSSRTAAQTTRATVILRAAGREPKRLRPRWFGGDHSSLSSSLSDASPRSSGSRGSYVKSVSGVASWANSS